MTAREHDYTATVKDLIRQEKGRVIRAAEHLDFLFNEYADCMNQSDKDFWNKIKDVVEKRDG